MHNLTLILPTSRATGTIEEGPLASGSTSFTSGTATEQVYNKNNKKHLIKLQRRGYKGKEIKKSGPLLH